MGKLSIKITAWKKENFFGAYYEEEVDLLLEK